MQNSSQQGDQLAEGQMLGPYRIVRLLGVGGMGAVYEARQEPLNRRVALKKLHVQYGANADIVARFFNEAKVLSSLQHPSLVQVSDFGHALDGSAYLVMEYLAGQSLTNRLAAGSGKLSLLAAIQLAWQIADVLTIAHAQGVVHRDLKPDNLMLVADPVAPGGERVKILDFGIAKLTNMSERGGARTHTQAVLGTPMYMSPEQCLGAGGVDGRSDVYALGCVLYRVLAGFPPFSGDGVGPLIAMHLYAHPPVLSIVAPDVPVVVSDLVGRLLVKKKSERPRMADVATELDRILIAMSRAEVSRSMPVASRVLTLQQVAARLRNAGKYQLQKFISAELPTPTPAIWKQHALVVGAQSSRDSNLAVLTLIGGSDVSFGLSRRDALRIIQYVVRRGASSGSTSLPPVLDHGEAWTDGPYYLLTPHYQQLLSTPTSRSFTVPEVLLIIRQVAEAVIAEQQREPCYVHGGICPDSVALEDDGMGCRRAILLDVSLRSILGRTSVPDTRAARSPFVAQELLEQVPAASTADTFSLGMLLYYLLGGDVEAARNHLQTTSAPLNLPSQLGSKLAALLITMLHPSAALRPSLEFVRDCILDGTLAAPEAVAARIHTAKEGPADDTDVEADVEPSDAELPRTDGCDESVTELSVRQFLDLANNQEESELPLASGGRVQVMHLRLERAAGEPIVLPLNLQGLVINVACPLLLRRSSGLLELCMSPLAMSASCSVRIYASAGGSVARSTYVLPTEARDFAIYVGHHRGPLYAVHVSSCSQSLTVANPLSLSLYDLDVGVVAPQDARTLVVLWRAAPETGNVHMVCITAD